MSYDKDLNNSYDKGPQKEKEPFTFNPITILNRFMNMIIKHHKRAFGAAWDSFLEGLDMKPTKNYHEKRYRNREEQIEELMNKRDRKLKAMAELRSRSKKSKRTFNIPGNLQDMDSKDVNQLINNMLKQFDAKKRRF